MGDVPISYIEGVGGTRVSEEDVVAVGKHDVSLLFSPGIASAIPKLRLTPLPDPIVQSRSIIHSHSAYVQFRWMTALIMNTP